MNEMIINSIKQLKSDFKKDELAYLALTSKVENPLRDRIAYNLYSQIGNDYIVCREWRGRYREEGKRHATDLAILNKGEKAPRVLIEFKAQSKPIFEPKYSVHMRNDLKYLNIKSANETELYYVQFTNLPIGKNLFNTDIYDSIKYFEGINRSIQKFDNLENEVDNSWQKHLDYNEMNTVQSKKIKIAAGQYHGNEMSVIVHVLGPINKNDLHHL